MRAGRPPDHGSLALLAQNQAGELRPLLLRVHVQNFIAAPRRDPASIASFETIALGLIPLVPDDALADAAAMLRECEDVPRRVRAALADRLGGPSEVSIPAGAGATPGASEKPDLAMARDGSVTLAGAALSSLIERATSDAKLAAAILARPEPSVFDRAALYRHADDATRAAIRHSLGSALAAIHLPPPVGASEATREITRATGPGSAVALPWALAARLGVDAAIFDLRSAAGQELLLFAMMTVGLDEEERLRTLLHLDDPLARSVEGIFRLVQLGRETPRSVAAFLAGHERIAPVRGRPSDEALPTRAAGSLRADGRADPTIRRPDRSARERAPIARPDRRP